jgi:hypothetical protein
MKKIIKKFIITVIVILPLLVSISYIQTRLNKIREEKQLIDTTVVENATPMIAFITVALGSFRGLAADFLWLRVNEMQMDGKYYEMYQLSTWIAQLQPRFSGSISHLAWNMAYNVSVTCSSHKDRWRWVNKGIALIRDQAIPNNPTDPVLYKELAWIYIHKIGNVMDEANLYYKNRMAIELMQVFGSADPDWKKFVEAPRTFSDLCKEINITQKEFLNILKSNDFNSLKSFVKAFRKTGKIPKITTDAFSKHNLELIEYFLRASWMRQEYKLDPETIWAINERYGKLDWRLPSSHTIYWATKGIENAGKGKDTAECSKLISIGLHDAALTGKMIMLDPNKPYTFMAIPNFDVFDAVIAEDKKSVKDISGDKNFSVGLQNFLKDIIVLSYTYGKYSIADKYYAMLEKEFPGFYGKSMEDFAMQKWKEDAKVAIVKQAYDVVSGLLYRAYYFAAAGDDDAARASVNLAQAFYNMYLKQHSDDQKRVGLPPMKEIKKYMREVFKNSMGIDADKIIIPNTKRKPKINLNENK